VVQVEKSRAPGAKAPTYLPAFAARLKSCPFATKPNCTTTPGSIGAAMARKDEREAGIMSLLDALKKGLGFVLLSMGVSRPAPKPKAETPPAPKG